MYDLDDEKVAAYLKKHPDMYFDDLASYAGATVYSLDELDDMYAASLSELGDVQIGNSSYSSAEALKKVDPIAYREGRNDWADGEFQEYDDYYFHDDAAIDIENYIDSEDETLEEPEPDISSGKVLPPDETEQNQNESLVEQLKKLL
jgi:hypothetical protein